MQATARQAVVLQCPSWRLEIMGSSLYEVNFDRTSTDRKTAQKVFSIYKTKKERKK
jgi:hypothetical protein